MSTLPTGTVTFLFTDIEGSTQLWDRQPAEMRADLARHDILVQEAIRAHDGSIFKTMGDAFCASFPKAHAALEAALDAQRALQGHSWSVAPPGLRARMALHTGEAEERGSDYFGPPLNRAARLRDAAHGGQILISQATEQLVRDDLPAGVGLADLGPHRLKDLARPEHVFQLQHPALPGEFPRLRSLDTLPNNLPQRLDSFIGRAHDLAEVRRLLSTARLLTLTGVGGAGKTRLAQQAAAEGADGYPGGVWLVSLEALSDPALVPQAVAQAVGLREQPGRPLVETLCETLHSGRVLLLLDNCEHLVQACARLTQTLLQACPQMQILATSREPLMIGGEVLYPIPPLPVPDARCAGTPEALSADFEAVRLFVDRAALSLPSFALTAQNAPAVARICRQLDGIPLAIELAAPRIKVLSPDQISQRLEDRFRLLTGGSRTALPRQQTMRALIDWSHDLLSEPERLLFRRLSVFAGGWAMEAAEAICAGDGVEEWEVMDLLSSLAAKSLVQVEEVGGGEKRYRMLETLRQYSAEQFLASAVAADVRVRHGDWFLALAERGEPELRGARQQEWLDRLEAEHDNFRAALSRMNDAEKRLRLSAALHRFWWMRGYMSEGRQWLDAALAGADGTASRRSMARALTGAGVLAWSQSENDAAKCSYQQALSLYQELEDQDGIARTLTNLGIVADAQEDPAARRLYEQSLAIFNELGDRRKIAYVLVNLAAHDIAGNDPDEAQSLLEECLKIREELQDQSGIATAVLCQGQAAYKRGQWEQARAHYQRGLAIRRDLGDQPGVAVALLLLAFTEAELKHHQEAVRLLGASQILGEFLHVSPSSSMRREREELTQSLSAVLDEEDYAAAWQQGVTMSVEQAVFQALQQ